MVTIDSNNFHKVIKKKIAWYVVDKNGNIRFLDSPQSGAISYSIFYIKCPHCSEEIYISTFSIVLRKVIIKPAHLFCDNCQRLVGINYVDITYK